MRLCRVLSCMAFLGALAAVGCMRQPRFTIPDEALLPVDRSSPAAMPEAAENPVRNSLGSEKKGP